MIAIKQGLKKVLREHKMREDDIRRAIQNLSGGLFERFARELLRRNRARDLYDVWYLLKYQAGRIDGPTTKDLFLAKCDFKGVEFGGWDDFFEPAKLGACMRAWEASLRRQLADVPSYQDVEGEVRLLIKDLSYLDVCRAQA